MGKMTVSVFVLGLAMPSVALAERPPEQRNKADMIMTGTIKSIKEDKKPFSGDGVMSNYTAEVVVDAVEKGPDLKTGSTIKITWFNVTKRPSKPLPAAYGHKYKLKAKDKVNYWLMKTKTKGVWTIIYNKDGAEKVQKKKDK